MTAVAGVPISRSRVPRALIHRASLRGLLRMALEEWTIIILCWLALLGVPGAGKLWLYPFVCLALAGRFHALGVLLHDASHMPLRRKSVRAYLIEALCGYPIASTIDAMRYHHLRHHRDSGMETDPYLKNGTPTPWWWCLNVARGALLVPFWTVRAIVGLLAIVAPGVRNIYGHVFLQDRDKRDLTCSAELRACARAELGQIIAQAFVVAAVLRWPLPAALGYLLPITIAGMLSARRLLLEHTNEPTTDRRPETIIATTRDNHLDLLGSLLLAPRNVGCHIVHHLHPQVGLEHLPRLRAWYLEQYGELYPRPRAAVLDQPLNPQD